MGNLLIRNAMLVATMDDSSRELPDCDIRVEGSTIVEIGKGLEKGSDEIFAADGCLVIPGLINTHNHSFQAVYRVISEMEQVTFENWIASFTQLWFRHYLTPETIFVAARANFAELLLSGCTTSADQHYLYRTGETPEYVDRAVEAALEIGIRYHPARGCLTLGKSRGGLVPDEFTQPEDEVLRHSQELIDKYHDPEPFAKTRIVLAPMGIYSDSETIYREMKALADDCPGVRCHTHLHEIVDEEFTMEKYGDRPLDFMDRMGWAGPEVLFYHFVSPEINTDEIRRVAEAGSHVSHCVASDLRLGYGLVPVRDLLNAGAHVCLGTTGQASNTGADIVQEMKLCLLAHRLRSTDPEQWLSAREIIRMGTRGGANALGREDLGSIEVGKAADLAIYDLSRIDMAGQHDPLASLILMGSNHQTKATIVDGKIVAENGRLLNIDQELAAQEVRDWARRVTD